MQRQSTFNSGNKLITYVSEHTLFGVKTMQRKKGRIISAVNNNQEVSITQIKKNKQDVIKKKVGS